MDFRRRSRWGIAIVTYLFFLQVVNALAGQVPIVTPAYFTDLGNAVMTKQCLPDPKNFLPKLSEVSLNVNQMDCGIREERRELFKVIKHVPGGGRVNMPFHLLLREKSKFLSYLFLAEGSCCLKDLIKIDAETEKSFE